MLLEAQLDAARSQALHYEAKLTVTADYEQIKNSLISMEAERKQLLVITIQMFHSSPLTLSGPYLTDWLFDYFKTGLIKLNVLNEQHVLTNHCDPTPHGCSLLRRVSIKRGVSQNRARLSFRR